MVKRIRDQRWLAATLVGLLLTVVAAPAISRMTCTMGGHVSYTVGADFDCCPDDHPTDRPSVGSTCCEISQASPVKADYVQHMQVGLDDALASIAAVFVVEVPVGDAPGIHWLDHRPPPLLLSDRLAALGSYLI